MTAGRKRLGYALAVARGGLSARGWVGYAPLGVGGAAARRPGVLRRLAALPRGFRAAWDAYED